MFSYLNSAPKFPNFSYVNTTTKSSTIIIADEDM